jgi:uncharacterized protein (TIGR00245 family)
VDSYIALNYWDLAAASILVLVNASLSIIFKLRFHRSLLIAAIRMVVQLALVGLVLTTLFSVVSPLWTGLAALAMVLFAGHEAAQRQDRPLSGWWSYGLGTGSMMMSSVLVTVFALLTALRPNPWYDPRYAIPLLGMILGNCMTGVALGLDTLTTSLVSRRAGVEAQLMLGATRQRAVAPVTDRRVLIDPADGNEERMTAGEFEARHPGRLGEKMAKSLAQNAASSWTQSGFLEGAVRKCRIRAKPTPTVAAYAAFIASVCGFSGGRLIESRWLTVLDQPALAPSRR